MKLFNPDPVKIEIDPESLAKLDGMLNRIDDRVEKMKDAIAEMGLATKRAERAASELNKAADKYSAERKRPIIRNS